MRFGFFAIIITLAILSIITFVLIRYAQGYRLDNLFTKDPFKVTSTGLLVATSTPDGAALFIDDKLTSATNTTLDLPPGTYKVKITKEGYLPWEKTLTIQKEIVTQTQAVLFPQAPKLESLTRTGILSPLLDPTGTSIAYGVASASATAKNGVYVLNMQNPILRLQNNPVQIADENIGPLSSGVFSWTPKSTDLIVTLAKTASPSATNPKNIYVLRADGFNATLTDMAAGITTLEIQWRQEQQELDQAAIEGLKPDLTNFISNHFRIISWSVDKSKILYEASGSALATTPKATVNAPQNQPVTIPALIDPPLLGTSTQKEDRQIKEGNFYVYDIKEDKNFFLKEVDRQHPAPLWISTSRHLAFIEDGQIKIIEYDGTNKTTIYSGPFDEKFMAAWPDGSRLVILTSLNTHSGVSPNLYTINLR